MSHKRRKLGSERPSFKDRDERNPTGGHPVPQELHLHQFHTAENVKLRGLFVSGNATKLLRRQATVFEIQIIKWILSFTTTSTLTDVTLTRKSDTVVSKIKNIV